MEPSLQELKQRSEDNLISFLRTEAELAATYCDMATFAKNQEHRTQLMGDIQKIVNALRHFGGWVEDRSIRADILKEADRLSEFLDRNSK